jgi:hypothetical protein
MNGEGIGRDGAPGRLLCDREYYGAPGGRAVPLP